MKKLKITLDNFQALVLRKALESVLSTADKSEADKLLLAIVGEVYEKHLVKMTILQPKASFGFTHSQAIALQEVFLVKQPNGQDELDAQRYIVFAISEFLESVENTKAYVKYEIQDTGQRQRLNG